MFMIGGREQICEEFEPSAALMESYLCTMLEGVRDDALISQIMAQIQLDNPGFDYKSELAGVMDGYDRKRGARRLFLLWHMQTEFLRLRKHCGRRDIEAAQAQRVTYTFALKC